MRGAFTLFSHTSSPIIDSRDILIVSKSADDGGCFAVLFFPKREDKTRRNTPAIAVELVAVNEPYLGVTRAGSIQVAFPAPAFNGRAVREYPTRIHFAVPVYSLF